MASAKSVLSVMLVIVGAVVLIALPTSTVVAEMYFVPWVAGTNFGVLGHSLGSFSGDVALATIEVGDTLRFEYNNINDNVLEVTSSAVRQCDSSAPLREWSDGDTSITFLQEGVFFFISGISDHCLQNQRLAVNVVGHRDAEEHRPHHRMAEDDDPCKWFAFPGCT